MRERLDAVEFGFEERDIAEDIVGKFAGDHGAHLRIHRRRELEDVEQ
jgi:hypothetical protein